MSVDWEFILQHPIEDWRDYYTLSCPICGCGSDDIRDLLHECLEWAASENRHDRTDEWKQGFYRSREHQLAAHVLDNAELIEHGTGIGWAWATDDGRHLLQLVAEWKEKKEARP